MFLKAFKKQYSIINSSLIKFRIINLFSHSFQNLQKNKCSVVMLCQSKNNTNSSKYCFSTEPFKKIQQSKSAFQNIEQSAKQIYQKKITQNPEKYIDLTINYYQVIAISNPIQSIRLMKQLIQNQPNINKQQLSIAHLSLGTCYCLKKQYQQSFKHLKKADQLTQENDKSSIINFNIAGIHQKLNNIKEAWKYYQKSFDKDPTNQQLFFRIVTYYFQQKNIEKIKQYQKKGYKYFPNDFKIISTFGEIYCKIKQFKVGLKLLEKALEMNPQQFFVYQTMLNCLLIQKQFQKAIQLYQLICEKFPQNKKNQLLCYWMGIAYFQTKKIQLAISMLNNVTFQFIEFSISQYMLGICYMQLKSYVEAKKCFQKCIKLNFSAPVIYQNLADCQIALQNYQRAIQLFQKQNQLDPQNAQIQFKLGVCYHFLERISQAISYYKKVLQINPNYIQCILNLGHCYIKAGMLIEGIKKYEQILMHDAENIQVNQNLALALMSVGRYSEAKTKFQKIIHQRPSYQNYAHLAYCHNLFYNLKEAELYCKKAISIKPNGAQALLLLKQIQKMKKQENQQ